MAERANSTSRRALLSGLAAIPTLTLPALAAPPASDLARACLWAVAHRTWIDTAATDEHWTDERLDEELDRVNAVFTRAIKEPSSDLHDLSAKAALALEDYERFTAVPGDDLDDGERIVLTVLREIVAMGGAA